MSSDGAFNQMATDYDAVFTNSTIGRLQRQRVWDYLGRNIQFPEGFRVLELNCGTGEDATIFAQKGCSVTATDISSEMLRLSKAKADNKGVSDAIDFVKLDIDKISEHNFEQQFDLVFSNFGGLNCVTEASLRNLSQKLKSTLKPNGRLVTVVMPAKCMMETLYFLSRFDVKNAFRRGSKQVDWENDQGELSSIYYYSPSEFASFFKSEFVVDGVAPIGFCIPPSYTEPFFSRHQRILGVLDKVDQVLDQSFFSGLSDHYLIDFKVKN